MKNQPQLIHIATHGFANPNSYRNAGLFFTGLTATGKQLNNQLGMFEIEQLQNNAELVVLTACESNLGKINFLNGSDSLAFAFARSGAKRVIASQWSIPSRSSSMLVTNFYKELANYQDASRALNEAMKKQRATTPHPFYWAGLTINNFSKGASL